MACGDRGLVHKVRELTLFLIITSKTKCAIGPGLLYVELYTLLHRVLRSKFL